MDDDAFDPVRREAETMYFSRTGIRVCEEVISIMSDPELYNNIFTRLSSRWHRLRALGPGLAVELPHFNDWEPRPATYSLGST